MARHRLARAGLALALVWAMGIAYVVWDEVPTLQLLTGASIVVAAGLYLLWHEARQRAEKTKG